MEFIFEFSLVAFLILFVIVLNIKEKSDRRAAKEDFYSMFKIINNNNIQQKVRF